MKKGQIIAVGAILVMGLAGCAATTDSAAPKAAAPPPKLDNCSSEVMADTQAYISKFTQDRITKEGIPTGWDGSLKLSDNSTAMAQITRAAMLPCVPTIDVNTPASNPANVATIQQVMNLDLWSKIILPNKAGKGEPAGAQPAGFTDPAESYKTFLTDAARFPFFCGEKGTWANPAEACQRELSALFAHAIQETGEKPVPPDEQPWQTALFYTRELGCYPDKCTQYNTDSQSFGAPSSSDFYGRGIKQLSYPYNYAAFSASFYGDMSVLINNPDLVGSQPDLILGSGIWFLMSPQNPKPSMHGLMIGSFEPHDMPADGFKGVTTQKDGSIYNRFASTVSVINGAIECSPENGSGTPEQKQENLERSKNRFSNFKSFLGVYGVTEAQQSANEKAIVPGTTYCEIANGNPWGETLPNSTVTPISFSLPFYIDAGSPAVQAPGTCFAVGWGQAVPLPASAEGMYQLCLDKFHGSNPSPTSSSATPTSSSASPQPTDPEPTTTSSGGVVVTLTLSGPPWDDGYCGSFTGKNTSNKAVSSWNFSFDVQASQEIYDPWSGTPTRTGNTYKVVPNTLAIPAGGTVTGMGFCMKGGNAAPTNLTATSS